MQQMHTAQQVRRPEVRTDRSVVFAGACALALAMGVGRFVYTPILPMMRQQAHLSGSGASALATGNYVGYLLGALAATAQQSLGRRAWSLRISAVTLIATLALMPVTTGAGVWTVLRTVAGFDSALIFLVASNTVLEHLRSHRSHLAGWVYGGVGTGIVLSGVMSLIVGRAASWRVAWFAAAVMCLVLLPFAWRLGVSAARGGATAPSTGRRGVMSAGFTSLLVSYILEGAGYIIAGTFLVAAVTSTGSAALGAWAWVVAGLAAAPSCVLWARAAQRLSRPTLVMVALLVQAVGMALPAATSSAAASLVAAALFGGTFMGITTLVLAQGRASGSPRAVAVLSTGYALGQVAGPLVVAPFLAGGYRTPLLIAAALAAVAALIVGVGGTAADGD